MTILCVLLNIPSRSLTLSTQQQSDEQHALCCLYHSARPKETERDRTRPNETERDRTRTNHCIERDLSELSLLEITPHVSYRSYPTPFVWHQKFALKSNLGLWYTHQELLIVILTYFCSLISWDSSWSCAWLSPVRGLSTQGSLMEFLILAIGSFQVRHVVLAVFISRDRRIVKTISHQRHSL
jgi:hypothetical protein